MAELNLNSTIELLNGKSCVVKKELGRGGQGIVYKVEYDGHPYALKWYTVNPGQNFYQNLCDNANRTAPSPNFVWPLVVTKPAQGSFGYIMALRPSGYFDMSDFLLKKKEFTTVDAQLNACLQICKAFRDLHAEGLSYQDLNDGNFFINPKTGDVLICDNDNVVPDNTNMGIIGKAGYLAPEIIEGDKMPNRYTDYYSLAVCLFILIYMNRPFEGRKYLSCPCDNNPDFAKKLFGYESVFIMDETDGSNRPVRGFHTNVINRWNIYPRQLQQAFCKTFSKEAQRDPTKRLMESTWIKILQQTRSLLVKCPECGNATFVGASPAEKRTCFWCKKEPLIPGYLNVGGFSIPLVSEQKIYSSQCFGKDGFTNVAAETIIKGGEVGLVNRSNVDWDVTLPNGNVNLVRPGEGMPARSGFKIRFGIQGCDGEIVK